MLRSLMILVNAVALTTMSGYHGNMMTGYHYLIMKCMNNTMDNKESIILTKRMIALGF